MAEDKGNLLRPQSGVGKKVKRLNRLPMMVVGGFATLVALVLIYSFYYRDQQQRRTTFDQNEDLAADQADPGKILSDAPKGGIIGSSRTPSPPKAQTPPNQDVALPMGQPVAQPAKSPEDIANEEAWARYRKREEQLAQQEGQALDAALVATSDIEINRAAMPQTQQVQGAGALPATAAGTNAALGIRSPTGGTGNDDPNRQSQKAGYLGMSAQPGETLPNLRQELELPYQIRTGTIIPSAMISGINSDLPGPIIAQVRENVYDTATGRYLLIPQGSKLFGQYDNGVTFGQERVLVVWNRITFPDGSVMNIDRMPGSDVGGYAGFNDQVNNHYVRIVGGALLMSAFSAGAQLSQPQATAGQSISSTQTAAAALGQEISKTGASMAQRNLGIAPTLEIRTGYRFNVIVTKDMVFTSPFTSGSPAPALVNASMEEPKDVGISRPAGTRSGKGAKQGPTGPELKGWRMMGASPDEAVVMEAGQTEPETVHVGDAHPRLGIVLVVKEMIDGQWLLQTSRGWLLGQW